MPEVTSTYTPNRMRRGFTLADFLGRYGTVVGFVILVIVSSIISPRFLTTNNLLNVIRQVSVVGIVAIGGTFVILTNGIDLSVGSVLALSVVTVASVLETSSPVTAILVGMTVGMICGLVNGLGITWGKVQPFIMTLGMLGIARGIAFIYTRGIPIPVLNETFLYIGNGYLLGMPIPSLIFLGMLLIAFFVLKYTPFGRYVYALGSSEEAARLSGVNVGLYTTAVYVISGLTAGVAGILYAAQLGVGPPIAGEGYDLDAIAAVVVGGTPLSGGQGGVAGTLLGALIIGVLANVLNLNGVSPFVQRMAKGLLIVLAVMIGSRGRKSSR